MSPTTEDAGPDAMPYDLFSQAFLADPFATFRRMRAEHPVYWHPLLNAWVLTRYDDVLAALRDRRFSSGLGDRFAESKAPPHMRAELAVCNRFISMWTVCLDPPRHTVLRALLAKAFTGRGIEGLRPFAEQIVDEMLDAAMPVGKMDLVKDLASPLPAVVIAQMLGIPDRDLGVFKSLTNDVFAIFSAHPLTEEAIATCHRGVVGLLDYFHGHIEERRQSTRDDLLSRLITVEEQGTVLTEEELVATCSALLIAGHETTTHLISNGVLALLQNPAQLEDLRSHPDLLPGAVEEMLRYDGAAMTTVRTALEDVEVGGQRIAAGQLVFLGLHAGNRDPAHFSDPDRLDIRRKDAHHLAFGQGIHYCIGASLARLETQVALRKILERLPGLRLEPRALEWIPSIVVHGLVSLLVRFDAPRSDV